MPRHANRGASVMATGAFGICALPPNTAQQTPGMTVGGYPHNGARIGLGRNCSTAHLCSVTHAHGDFRANASTLSAAPHSSRWCQLGPTAPAGKTSQDLSNGQPHTTKKKHKEGLSKLHDTFPCPPYAAQRDTISPPPPAAGWRTPGGHTRETDNELRRVVGSGEEYGGCTSILRGGREKGTRMA
jgi:hypothetical protein